MPKKVVLAHHDLEPIYSYYDTGYVIKFYCPYCNEPNDYAVWNKKKGKDYVQCQDCGQEVLVEWEDR